MGNRMNASAIKDVHYKRYLKILLKLYQPLGECKLKEFSNITSTCSMNMFLHKGMESPKYFKNALNYTMISYPLFGNKVLVLGRKGVQFGLNLKPWNI